MKNLSGKKFAFERINLKIILNPENKLT